MNRVQQPPKMRRHSRRLHVQRGKVRNELLNARGHQLERRLLSCGVPAPRGDTVASNCRHLPDGGVSPSHIAPAESPEGGQAPSSADAVATPPHSALRPRWSRTAQMTLLETQGNRRSCHCLSAEATCAGRWERPLFKFFPCRR